MLKITVIKPNGPSAEVELEGVIEELRRDKKMYKKTAMLQLRSATPSDWILTVLFMFFMYIRHKNVINSNGMFGTDSPSRPSLRLSCCGRLSQLTSTKASTSWSLRRLSAAAERSSTR